MATSKKHSCAYTLPTGGSAPSFFTVHTDVARTPSKTTGALGDIYISTASPPSVFVRYATQWRGPLSRTTRSGTSHPKYPELVLSDGNAKKTTWVPKQTAVSAGVKRRVDDEEEGRLAKKVKCETQEGRVELTARSPPLPPVPAATFKAALVSPTESAPRHTHPGRSPPNPTQTTIPVSRESAATAESGTLVAHNVTALTTARIMSTLNPSPLPDAQPRIPTPDTSTAVTIQTTSPITLDWIRCSTGSHEAPLEPNIPLISAPPPLLNILNVAAGIFSNPTSQRPTPKLIRDFASVPVVLRNFWGSSVGGRQSWEAPKPALPAPSAAPRELGPSAVPSARAEPISPMSGPAHQAAQHPSAGNANVPPPSSSSSRPPPSVTPARIYTTGGRSKPPPPRAEPPSSPWPRLEDFRDTWVGSAPNHSVSPSASLSADTSAPRGKSASVVHEAHVGGGTTTNLEAQGQVQVRAVGSEVSGLPKENEALRLRNADLVTAGLEGMSGTLDRMKKERSVLQKEASKERSETGAMKVIVRELQRRNVVPGKIVPPVESPTRRPPDDRTAETATTSSPTGAAASHSDKHSLPAPSQPNKETALAPMRLLTPPAKSIACTSSVVRSRTRSKRDESAVIALDKTDGTDGKEVEIAQAELLPEPPENAKAPSENEPIEVQESSRLRQSHLDILWTKSRSTFFCMACNVVGLKYSLPQTADPAELRAHSGGEHGDLCDTIVGQTVGMSDEEVGEWFATLDDEGVQRIEQMRIKMRK